MQLPVIPGHKFFDFFLALDDNHQRRGLHAANRRELKSTQLGVECRHGTGAVDTHQPIGLGTADGSVRQGPHVGIGTQRGKGFANGALRHGLKPQPLDGLAYAGKLRDITKNKLTLAAGVTGIHQRIYILALDQPEQDFEPRRAFLDRLQIEMRGNNRQVD